MRFGNCAVTVFMYGYFQEVYITNGTNRVVFMVCVEVTFVEMGTNRYIIFLLQVRRICSVYSVCKI